MFTWKLNSLKQWGGGDVSLESVFLFLQRRKTLCPVYVDSKSKTEPVYPLYGTLPSFINHVQNLWLTRRRWGKITLEHFISSPKLNFSQAYPYVSQWSCCPLLPVSEWHTSPGVANNKGWIPLTSSLIGSPGGYRACILGPGQSSLMNLGSCWS